MVEHAADFTSRPVGSYWGGKRGRDHSVACPVCSKPALLIAKTIRKGADREQYAHYVAIRLNDANDAVPEYGAVCEFVRNHDPKGGK